MAGFTEGMRTSLTDDWPTPRYVFDKLDEEFHFEIDVCADDRNHKAPIYFTKEIDGLKQEWKGICWMNPPYGRTIGDWVKKAYESANRGGGWDNRRMSPARTHRYQMVEGLRHACF